MTTRRDVLRWSGSAIGAVLLGGKLCEMDGRAEISSEIEAGAPSVTSVWAEAIAKARYQELSPEVIKRTKLCILDNIGVIAQTSTLKEAHTFLERPLTLGGPAAATVWGINAKLPLETATACNAYLIHGNEIDDSDFRSNYRASCVSLPAPLTVAEYTHASGRDLERFANRCPAKR